MSVDFNAILALTRKGVAIDDWAELLRGLGPHTDAVIERCGQRWSAKEWSAKPRNKSEGFIDVIGPGGFWIVISRVACKVYHCVKFDHFCFDPHHQRMLRGAMFELARLVGSDRAIYMPEMTPHSFLDGGDIRQIEADLLDGFGPPAPSLSEIGDRFEPHSYFIDRFADLRETSAS